MSSFAEAAHGHIDRVLQTVRGAPAKVADNLVAQSWVRCVNDYRLHPGQAPSPTIVSAADLERRRDRNADIIACARYEMSTLFQQLGDSETAIVLTDTDGVILHMMAAPEFADEVARLGLRTGGTWSETEAGTNGMGTCLAAGRPVAVQRDEHFFARFIQLTCSAVPVHDPSGQIAAVLDATSRSRLTQQHLLLLLGMTARMIENRLIDLRFRNAHPVHFHSRPEFVYTLHEGKLAVGDDGRVLAANHSALVQLGLHTVQEVRGRPVEELFQTSLDDMLRRSAAASYHPLVTYGANAAMRYFAVARRPASAVGKPIGADAERASVYAGVGGGAVETPAGAAIFADPRLASNLQVARRVIAHRTPVLLCGETGSGKEVFARAVHAASPHATGPFVAVNCASLPESLIESELFGYRAGAFTGAQRSGRRGKILQADGGTLFLDEIADMPIELQARLLRVLDERRITPLGTEDVQPVDFQLISASHEHLPTKVREGRFREDLYYRLAGIELSLPPLRERSDRRELILSMLAAESGGQGRLTPQAERMLLEHAWPGNVRQLGHVLRTACALADDGRVGAEHLLALLGSPEPPAAATLVTGSAPVDDEAPPVKLNAIQANERKVLLELLAEHRWNVSHVAKVLDVSRTTFYRKLHRLHIRVSRDL